MFFFKHNTSFFFNFDRLGFFLKDKYKEKVAKLNMKDCDRIYKNMLSLSHNRKEKIIIYQLQYLHI